MPSRVRVAAYQGPEPAGPAAALAAIEDVAREAAERGARVLCLPECYLTGYFTDADAARPHAIALDSERFRRVLAKLSALPTSLVVGFVEAAGGALFNSAAVISQGPLP